MDRVYEPGGADLAPPDARWLEPRIRALPELSIGALRAAWTAPMEVSIVSIPADSSVGVGRSKYSAANLIISERNEMTENTDNIERERAAARVAERERIDGIRGLTQRHGIPANVADRAIADGTSLDDFRPIALEAMPKHKPLASPHVERDSGQPQYSFARAVRGVLTGHMDGLEAEESQELELNPFENIWQFLRDNWLSNRVFRGYDDIVAHCCDAWNELMDQPWWKRRCKSLPW